MREYTARAHTNIALLKYWGKADTDFIIPTTTSISLTLDEFYTDTSVKFDDDLVQDQVFLNDAPLAGKSYDKIVRFLDIVRQEAQLSTHALVKSTNHVPTAAGLASSASAFAALAGSASKAAGLNLTPSELSRLARRGSGSASRSIFGGFVEWQRGDSDESSYAKVLQADVDWDIQLLTVIINDQPKKIDSRGGMQHTQATSPFYAQWVENTNAAVSDMEAAIAQHDFEKLGSLAESNALQMHATNTTANPPFNYLTDQSWTVIQLAATLRQKGIEVYATMDAGPNVKLISKQQDTQAITEALAASLPNVQTVAATPGPGIQIVKGAKL
ncbi:diphosphomevalonate decarboxylase [Weissella uvarum]|uniref:diphosphomevalonate decarboxylase n=1 Tax=Weissella uvarum TaxID=1479233 RepID=UPI0019611282|nr:diphosphomevalonate decarboxylase [Weissella uvarum]MBM7617462.1 diphosphomevalonate decarboxylase [Weissella uvarum]MCM0595653.1 diphosphomevalonate decarboxylase [Weissella uvarum]